MDEELEKWRNRPIGRIKYLHLDARYEKVRQDGMVLSCAVLVATGVNGRWEESGTWGQRVFERGRGPLA